MSDPSAPRDAGFKDGGFVGADGEEADYANVDVLVFDIGGRSYGTDASQVVRIGKSEDHAIELKELGALHHGTRALVFRHPEGEGQLRVDAVHGVKRIRADSLRRMPKPALARAYTVGIWLDGDRPVLLIDLPESLNFHARSAEAT